MEEKSAFILMERINVLIDAVKAGGDVYLDAIKIVKNEK